MKLHFARLDGIPFSFSFPYCLLGHYSVHNTSFSASVSFVFSSLLFSSYLSASAMCACFFICSQTVSASRCCTGVYRSLASLSFSPDRHNKEEEKPHERSAATLLLLLHPYDTIAGSEQEKYKHPNETL